MSVSFKPVWKWVVLFGAFIALFIGDGWLCTFGLIYSNLVVIFDESRAATSYVPTLLYGVPMALSPIACSAASRVGCRKLSIFAGIMLFLSFVLMSFANSLVTICIITGVLTSIGLKSLFVSAYVAVTYWFEEGDRGLGTGIAMTGSGLGSVVFPHLIDFLLNEYLWRGTFLIVGAICLHVSLSGYLYRPFPQNVICNTDAEVGSRSKGENEHESPDQADDASGPLKKLKEFKQCCCDICMGGFKDIMILLKKKIFIFYCLLNYVLYLCLNIPYLYTYDWASEHLNLSKSQNAWLMSIQGLSMTVGMLFIGFLADLSVLIRPNFLFGSSMIVCGTSTFLMPYCPSYELLLVCCSFFAFSGSVTFVLPFLCLGEVIGMQWSVAGFGFIHLVQGVSILTGTPVGGWIRDLTGNYDLAFYIAGLVISSTGSVFCLFSLWLKSKDSKVGRDDEPISQLPTPSLKDVKPQMSTRC